MGRSRAARRVAAGAAVVLVAAGCGGKAQPLTAPSLPGSTSPPTSRPPATSTSTTAPPTHPVGDALRLTGAGGLAAIVQVVAIVDPATAAAGYDHPGPGLRYVAARIAVNDIGPVPLTTNLLSDVAVDDGTGALVSPVVLDMANCPVDFGGELALGPGAVSVSCVAFEVPVAAPVKAVQVGIAAPPDGQATWTNP